jgi:hypothetical protein
MCLGILDHISQDILEFSDALPRLTEARESKRGDMTQTWDMEARLDAGEKRAPYTILYDVSRHIRSLYLCLIKESVAHYVGCLCLICL